MKIYKINGLVPVDISEGSILDPYTVYDYDNHDCDHPACTADTPCTACVEHEAKWNNFDIAKYKATVFDRAVIELYHLLQSLPEYLACTYVDGSAQIFENVLWFEVETAHDYEQERLQHLLESYLISGCILGNCNRCYNSSACNIFEYLRHFHSLDCFQLS